MKKVIFYFFFLLAAQQNLYAKEELGKGSVDSKGIVLSTFKIDLSPYKNAFNPSILEFGGEYVLTFRYMPEPIQKPWVSYVGIARLDKSFNLIGSAELLNLRQDGCLIPSQAEDARIFSYNKEIYIIYNDNRDVINTTPFDHREMFLAKVSYANGHFFASNPLKLKHPTYYHSRLWEKNWTPFVYEGALLLYYSLNPSEVIDINWSTGVCTPLCNTTPSINWKLGPIRGGTPAAVVGGEYLAFFHSPIQIVSDASGGNKLWHYFMGAYTFCAAPPFGVKKISLSPISERSFYTNSSMPKRVIYPGGYVISGKHIYLAYGKDDHEVWIAVIDKGKLMRSLRPVKLKATKD